MTLLSGSLRSSSLRGNTWVQIAAPTDLAHRDTPWPVVYVLHGTSGNSGDWVRFTRLPLYADEYGVIFVLPDVGNAWARDGSAFGDVFTYLVDELPDLLSSLLNTSQKRENVAIIGNSAGAYSALRCALLRPHQYWLAGAFSPGGLLLDEYLDGLRERHQPADEPPHLRTIFGPDLHYDDTDVLLRLVQKVEQEDLRPRLYIGIGTNDDLYPVAEEFARLMAGSSLDFVYEAWKGGHDWYFWDEALRRFLDRHYGQPDDPTNFNGVQ